ncbi:MAG: helix-turn-helix domain-containing protein [Pseudomonadota bacterium]
MRVAILVFPDFQLLDLSGPASVFGASGWILDAERPVIAASASGGDVVSSCGVPVSTVRLSALRDERIDTLLVAGGERDGLEALMADAETAAVFRGMAADAGRFGSICTGAFVLGAWGLLSGHRATTHWVSVERLAARFPEVDVDPDALFVEDGRLWTSAGVTTGIDMALAMVEREHGPDHANAIARRLVLSVRRPGYQSQFSPLLRAQTDERYRDLIGWIAMNLHARLDVECLAARVGQSPRSFHRHFRAATGSAPAAFVTAARLDRARQLLSEGQSVKGAAAACGFASTVAFGRRFGRAFGMTPGAFRALNFTGSAPPPRSSDRHPPDSA